MFGFKLWSAKPKKVLISGGAYLKVYATEDITAQKIVLADWLVARAFVLEAEANKLREEARKMME